MRKFFVLFAALVCASAMFAQLEFGSNRCLVAYFSATGNTRAVATMLSQVMNADLWEIVPAEPYTEADLNWRDKQSRSSLEMSDPEERPMIKMCTDIRPYDTIFVGYPIWWNTCPRIIDSWIENNDLTGKVLIPFATSGSSSIENSVKYLRAAYPDYNWLDGMLLNNATKAMLFDWKSALQNK